MVSQRRERQEAAPFLGQKTDSQARNYLRSSHRYKITHLRRGSFVFNKRSKVKKRWMGIQDRKVDVVTTKDLAVRIWIRSMRACTCGGATGRRMASGTRIGLWWR